MSTNGDFTPTDVASMIAHFEHFSSPLKTPFYYEASTNTINFGYGSNLTAAENSALSGKPALKDLYNAWLEANGIDLTAEQWASFASKNGKLSAANGKSVATKLNAILGSKDWTAAASSVMDSYIATEVVPALEKNT